MSIKHIVLITENSREMADLLHAIELLRDRIGVELSVISLAEIYKDKSLEYVIDSNRPLINNLLIVKNYSGKNFTSLSKISKLLLALSVRRVIHQFAKNADIVLSGVQIIFQRLLYIDMRNSAPFYVYHRHLIFNIGGYNCSINTSISIRLGKLLKLLLPNGLELEHYVTGYADRYMVLGPENKAFLIARSVPEDAIFCTGSVEFDHLSVRNKIANQYLPKCRASDSTESSISICYVTGAFKSAKDWEGSRLQLIKLKQFISYFQNNNLLNGKKVSLTIRVHPRESKYDYAELAVKYPLVNFQYACDTNAPLLDDLSKFDLLIGGVSTALFEASLVKIPILFYLMRPEYSKYESIVENIDSRFVISDLCQIKISEIAAMDYQRYITYSEDETAASRIANLVCHSVD